MTALQRFATLPWLVLGTALLAFSQGRWVIPILAFVAPVFLIHFTRHSRPALGYSGVVIGHTLAWEVAYLGMVPMPAFAHIGLFFSLSLVLGLVFLADRWANQRLPALPGSLVLPCGWVLFEFLIGLSPNGTWGSLAYSFSEYLPFAQLASLTGWTGISFFVIWTATIINQVWDRRPGHWQSAVVFGVVFISALAFGYLRLLNAPEPTRNLQAASVVAPSTFSAELIDQVWRYTRGFEQSSEDARLAQERIHESMDEHLSLVAREAQAGAELVVWAEANLTLTEAERAAWLGKTQALARSESIYLGMGATVFKPVSRERTENSFVLVGPDGEIHWQFIKATRAPGSGNAKGDGVLPRLDTDKGRWSGAICFDLDFPRLIRQAGQMDADIFIAPSNDWTEVAETHLRMHVFRAIEQGFVLFRPTKDGISAAVDPYGRVLARLDTEASSDKIMQVSLPTQGVTTVYSRIGDAFSWLASGLFFALLIFAKRSRRNSLST